MSSAESSSCVLISRRRRSEGRRVPHTVTTGVRTYRRGDIFHNQNILFIDILQVELFSNRNQLHITIMNDYVMGNICFIHRLDNGHPPAIHQDIEFYLNLCHWKLL